MNITLLGPVGATFSSIAYTRLTKLCNHVPKLNEPGVKVMEVGDNKDIVNSMIYHAGYGVIASETEAEGKIDTSINSLVGLVKIFSASSPVQILGALRMRIKFALMAQKGVTLKTVKTIHAHPQALGACNLSLFGIGKKIIPELSNGIAIQKAAQASGRDDVAAIGPAQAAAKYKLNILRRSLEDHPAYTTFLLLGPKDHPIEECEKERCLLVFRVKHEPGSLVKVLEPFSASGINLRSVHSHYALNGCYDFALETETKLSEQDKLRGAISLAQKHTDRCLQFGPYPFFSE